MAIDVDTMVAVAIVHMLLMMMVIVSVVMVALVVTLVHICVTPSLVLLYHDEWAMDGDAQYAPSITRILCVISFFFFVKKYVFKGCLYIYMCVCVCVCMCVCVCVLCCVLLCCV
jgi:hypothetical protein